MRREELETGRVIGFPLSRIDGPKKVTGTAPYAMEHPAKDCLYGFVATATIGAGRISRIDLADAAAMPGVVKIYTHENRPRTAWWDRAWKDEVALPGHPFRPLENDRVLFDGQPVALVIAKTFEAARDAASLIRVSYVAEPARTDLTAERDRAYVPKEKRSGISPPPAPRGDAEGSYEAAPYKIAAEYVLEGEYHNPMELYGSTVIYEGDGKLTIHDKTQGSQNVQNYICGIFELQPENVQVFNHFVGGAFGSGLRPGHQVFLATMAALDLKRSVKLELSRQEMFYLRWRPSTIQTVRMAADAQGQLQAILHHAVAATSVYEDYQETVVNWSGLAYKCDNVKLTYELASMHVSTPGDMRAPGAATGFVALECGIDELAYAVGIDPLEMRQRNFIHLDQNQGLQLTSKALHACYREGAKRFGWDSRSQVPRSMRDGHDLIGWGVATGIWEATLTNASARARLDKGGKVTVSAAASDIGTGTWTILAQVAAEAFGLSPDEVTVKIGDSSLPQTSVEGGSWTAASTGSAVDAAATAVRATLLSRAQAMPGSPFEAIGVEQTAIRAGRLVLDVNDQVGVALDDIFEASGLSFIEEEAQVAPDQKQAQRFVSYTHSGVFVEVRIDEELGVIRVTRVVIAVAAGRILNPKTARSQILGGVVMGIGMALHEEGMTDHRHGRIMNHNLAEYHIPSHADIADIDVIFVEEHDGMASPLGVKGLGEIGIVGVAAAVANAIFHATGTRIRHLPITIDKIFFAKEAAE
ncbi:xanthine dehydrogenase family protein molybdopterin-binding subunit [Rhizobium sp. SSA_523]|uniref:xanthine dehydrogenase family protein molybdopterin-binding subunit n=1 Tax=Rhizobium sp. SSA_523 TaxID=2952477 RepID=UPI0020904B68|nr:xanthine dehydrogenase family protein molybdopterin-binding subunit [Rhizobium sp. SSA_523]MCO5730920.1 xanthine dehydrogenase family protein molybdopterin-binding subunit [Rhizobium sp. SSA_523]WKC24268.1 xanthine dehydrogenase family protein molybdopterin-binding subunit [Rhizobium sp. SSA_523]